MKARQLTLDISQRWLFGKANCHPLRGMSRKTDYDVAETPATRQPAILFEYLGEAVFARLPNRLRRECPFVRNLGCPANVVAQCAKEDLRRFGNPVCVSGLELRTHDLQPQRLQFAKSCTENLERIMYVQDVLCSVVTVALFMNQNFLSDETHRVCDLNLGREIIRLEVN